MSFIAAIKQFKPATSHWLVATIVLFSIFARVSAQTLHFDKTVGESVSLPPFSTSGCTYTWVCDNPAIGLGSGGAGNVPVFIAKNSGNSPVTATITATPTNDGFAYIANAVTDNVSVINTSTHLLVKNVSVDNQPWGVAVSPDGKYVYVVNANNQNGPKTNSTLSVIDAATNTTVGPPIVLKEGAGSIAISPDGKKAYVAHKVSNQVAVIDLSSYAVSYFSITYALAVAVSSDGKRLYVVADSNTATGKLFIINPADNKYIGSPIDIGLNVTGIVVSPDCSKVYITNDYTNTISVIDAQSLTVSPVTVGNNPFAITISPDGNTVYVANSGSNSVSIFNTVTKAVSNLPLPGIPEGIAMSPNGKEVYVACQSPDQVIVINTATNTILPPIITGGMSAISLGSFVSAGIGCNNLPVTYTITVNPAPIIADPGSISSTLSTRYGTASTAQTISVAGNYLTGGIVVTAPAGFELSKDDITFTGTLTVGTGGNVAATEIFVRLKATTPAGSPAGNITLTSPGAADVQVPVDGAVIKAPLTITADNKTKFAGDVNPVLTVSYAGFVNNEGPAQLTIPPLITTTATTISPVGKYPITVSGAVAANYAVTSYVPGVLEILSGEIVAPNAFTPNGDGINDTWDVKYLNLYAGCTVEIMNRFGNKVFQSVGYPVAWDGTYNNADLPAGTYYYVIRLRSGAKPITGYIAIIR
ncbi:gliding motility-associated C-terminal domain-containing protein [Mucilaginibacter sp. UR6-11]|uniref:T9SS type B sorting domain-containing protein n=1 Tax=Mucilaginibacter sp. UR6-11 TaxID=1435644 RepID=UPI001E2A8176|nr:gliding motility-associated C-terminal domain-containing protein [Mucilaginibacter sp. UR6-11]MCC8423440.1 gliding motility-associated C-terminal domain-containing protein [Mucilaginibacter sp. UR6-11]